MDVLVFDQLEVRRGDGVSLLGPLSLTLRKGDRLALVGESGSGKSLLALAAVGALPSSLLATAQVLQRQGRSALAWQEPMGALTPVLTVGSQFDETIAARDGGRPQERLDRARSLLASVGFGDPDRVLLALPGELSGGMAQRVGLALAFAIRPDLLVVDEPTTALDLETRRDIVVCVLRYLQETGAALMLVTHDLDVAHALAQRVVVLYAGQVVEDGPVGGVLAPGRHPYTRALTSARSALEGGGLGGRVPAPGLRPSGCSFRDRCDRSLPSCADTVPLLGSWSTDHRVACPVVLGDAE